MPFPSTADIYQKSLTDNYSADCAMFERFNIRTLLHRFFTFQEQEVFQQLQYETKMFISGSVAQQFIDARHYDLSDLDLYVEHRFRFPIIHWILNIGYCYVPKDKQSSQSLPDAIGSVQHIVPPNEEARVRNDGAYKSAASILNFHHPIRHETIQLITTYFNPLEMVLNFHSTCVMNIITYDRAYALYPELTFVERLSLINNPISPTELHDVLPKYTARGWKFIEVPREHHFNNQSHSLYPGIRAFGDKKCWTIRLFPKQARVSSDIMLNTWTQDYDSYSRPLWSFYLYEFPNPDRYYLTADAETRILLDRMKNHNNNFMEFTVDDIKQLVSRSHYDVEID